MRKDHHLLEREIEKVMSFSLVDLRHGYVKHLKLEPPECFSHDLLRRAIIHAIEEKLSGLTLPRSIDRDLQRIGEASIKAARRPEIGGAKIITMKPGTEFIRVWQGRVYKVVVAADGFLWNGTTYASLSEIARAITGTRWNGPRFFGLRQAALAPTEKKNARAEARPTPGRPENRKSGSARSATIVGGGR